jgi:ABC-type Fe3+-hydroxamate transport system substrate-binding protein
MKVVSLVPSWTETLIEAGVDVVGRTRFCIHPKQAVQKIPIVGGTKNLKSAELASLKADLVILDREENPKEFLEAISTAYLDTHVTNLKSLALELERMSNILKNKKLQAFANRAKELHQCKSFNKPYEALILDKIENSIFDLNAPWAYVVWKNPWMCAGEGTYIQCVIEKLGYKLATFGLSKKYFEIAEEELIKNQCFFSSEPFPFKKSTIGDHFRGAMVDGECLSWFGIRSLRFLEQAFNLDPI